MKLIEMKTNQREEFFRKCRKEITTSTKTKCPNCGVALIFTSSCCYCRLCGWSSCKEA